MLGVQSLWGIFIVPHLLWHGTSVFMVSTEEPTHLVTSYHLQGDAEDLFLPRSLRVLIQSPLTKGKGMLGIYSSVASNDTQRGCWGTVLTWVPKGWKMQMNIHAVTIINKYIQLNITNDTNNKNVKFSGHTDPSSGQTVRVYIMYNGYQH
jgi:hypothetical protein